MKEDWFSDGFIWVWRILVGVTTMLAACRPWDAAHRSVVVAWLCCALVCQLLLRAHKVIVRQRKALQERGGL